jgi:hypothetical protein
LWLGDRKKVLGSYAMKIAPYFGEQNAIYNNGQAL